MKKSILSVALVLLASNAFASNESRVEIGGQSARKLYYALEQSGAEMGIHTRRITEYKLGNVYCYSETNVTTKEADFSCTITLTSN